MGVSAGDHLGSVYRLLARIFPPLLSSVLLFLCVCQLSRMSYSWTPMCSLTATKYQRYGFVEMKPFQPGERFKAAREMERQVKGYKELRSDLKAVRRLIRNQEVERNSSSNDKKILTCFYKSPVGTRSCKGPGAIFYSDPVGRLGFFSITKKM